MGKKKKKRLKKNKPTIKQIRKAVDEIIGDLFIEQMLRDAELGIVENILKESSPLQKELDSLWKSQKTTIQYMIDSIRQEVDYGALEAEIIGEENG